MEQLKYQIKMLSDWHIGSGLDSATDADALVLKDDNNLPYIPGKTIKGLIRDAFQDMVEVEQATVDTLIHIFGETIHDVDPDEEDQQISFSESAFFSNAHLPESVSKEIKNNNLSNYLYRNIASTAIDESGVAQGTSLRVTQVTTPLILEGFISGLNQEDHAALAKAIRLVRRLGVNRNRGLGRCHFFIPKKTQS